MLQNAYISGEISRGIFCVRKYSENNCEIDDTMIVGDNKNKEQNDVITPIDWSNYTFLVADDEELNLEFIEEVLSDTGVKLILAVNGKEAIERYNQNPNIKLVLLDIRMPLVDGYGAMKEIRSNNKNIPIIAQTAFALNEDKMKALSMGFTDYLEKPIEQEIIIQTINKYL